MANLPIVRCWQERNGACGNCIEQHRENLKKTKTAAGRDNERRQDLHPTKDDEKKYHEGEHGQLESQRLHKDNHEAERCYDAEEPEKRRSAGEEPFFLFAFTGFVPRFGCASQNLDNPGYGEKTEH